jgi:predicted site-specific integrase-resolvase
MQKNTESGLENPGFLNPIYNTKDLSLMLQVSTRTIQRWRDAGVIRYSSIGSKFYYLHSDVMEMIKTNTLNSNTNV